MFMRKHADVFFISVQKCRKFVQMFFYVLYKFRLKFEHILKETC